MEVNPARTVLICHVEVLTELAVSDVQTAPPQRTRQLTDRDPARAVGVKGREGAPKLLPNLVAEGPAMPNAAALRWLGLAQIGLD